MARYRRMKKWIAYSKTMRDDQIIQAPSIKEAARIAKISFGNDTKVQEFSKEDQEIWEGM